MAVRSETLTLESVARALELARQDVETVLGENADWLASRTLANDPALRPERDRLAARLALVPAYRAHRRISEALQQLSGFASAQTADRANGWGGEIPAAAASLHRASAEAGRLSRDDGDGVDLPPLSGWHADATRSDEAGAAPSVDLDQLISRIRQGASRRGPLPLQGLLAEAGNSPKPAAPEQGAGDEIAFPERAPAPEAATSAAVPETVELTPVMPWNETRQRRDGEIVVEEAKAVAIAAAGEAVPATDPLDQLSAMEAEIGKLEAGVARPLPPRPAGVGVPPGFDHARVDLGEALVEIVRKPRDQWSDDTESDRAGDDIIDVPVEEAADALPLQGDEALIEIIRRG